MVCREGCKPRQQSIAEKGNTLKREFLQNLISGDHALTKEIIDAFMAENGNNIEEAKKPFADYGIVKGQLAVDNKIIEGFKALDVDGIKKAAKRGRPKPRRLRGTRLPSSPIWNSTAVKSSEIPQSQCNRGGCVACL